MFSPYRMNRYEPEMELFELTSFFAVNAEAEAVETYYDIAE